MSTALRAATPPEVARAMPLLSGQGLRVELGGRTVVDGAELELRAGELLAIVGPNGAGKSTLLRTAAGLQRPAAGEVRWAGRGAAAISQRELARMRAYIPQRPRVTPGLTVEGLVAAGRSPHVGLLRRPGEPDRAAVARALERVGLGDLVPRQLTTLSGGELQRAFLALALAQDAAVLLADEPTAHLDLGARMELGSLLCELAGQGLGVAVVVHDVDLACALADRLLVLCDGRVAASGAPAEVMTPALLGQVWGVEARVELDDGRPRVVPLWSGLG